MISELLTARAPTISADRICTWYCARGCRVYVIPGAVGVAVAGTRAEGGQTNGWLRYLGKEESAEAAPLLGHSSSRTRPDVRGEGVRLRSGDLPCIPRSDKRAGAPRWPWPMFHQSNPRKTCMPGGCTGLRRWAGCNGNVCIAQVALRPSSSWPPSGRRWPKTKVHTSLLVC